MTARSGRTVGWRTRAGAVGAGTIAVMAMGVFLAPAASAHPLGNFTTNTAMAFRLTPDAVAVDYVVDEAEIPTV
ncbi:MAG: high frequency lysogenization protein HflD, partial [Thermoleophilia bacterium]|nr:high frequency lysogenization protein HflD [Thermoleophilia bacterium]